MRHFSIKRIFAAVLVVCCLSVTSAYAEVTQQDIDEAREQLEHLQDEKENVESTVENIAEQKEELEENLGSLNGQMTSIVTSMNELEVQISDKEAEIATAEDELAAAEAQSQQQYEDMKLRIQFMYENGNDSVLDMLLSSVSFAEFLNKTEYVSEINAYDRNMLTKFQELQEQIAEQKKGLEDERTDLLAMQEDMKAKQSTVNNLISATQANISQSEGQLASAQDSLEDIAARIRQMEEYEEQLELQKAREDAARLAAIRAQEAEDTSGVVYVPSDSDLYLLGAIIQCESDGEPYEGKLAVGSVVLNRVRSSYYPNTVSGVIYQSGQFSPVASGRYAYRLEAGVNSTCLQAAQEVLDGNITLNCLYFRTNNGIVTGTVIGNHVFY